MGGLLVAQAFDADQQQQGALLGRQLRKRRQARLGNDDVFGVAARLLAAAEPGQPARLTAFAAFTVDKLPVQDREQPGAQAGVFALLSAAAEGALEGGLDQVVGAAGLAGQPQGEAAQALEHLAQLLVV
ncbi:hypothetical protein D3C84_976120 [compost metagenome]